MSQYHSFISLMNESLSKNFQGQRWSFDEKNSWESWDSLPHLFLKGGIYNDNILLIAFQVFGSKWKNKVINGGMKTANYYMIREPYISFVYQYISLWQRFWKKIVVLFNLFLPKFTSIILCILLFLWLFLKWSNIQIFNVVNDTVFLKNFLKLDFLISLLVINMLYCINWNIAS